MSVTLGPEVLPQAFRVIFMDSFTHYDDLTQKWTSVQSGGGATPAIVHQDGTYYGLQDTTPLPLDDQYEKDTGGVLYISGEHHPVIGGRGDTDGSWPYVQKLLQRQAAQKIRCIMNLKAEDYTGVPFLRLLNEAGDLIVGFSITPEGSVLCCRGGDTSNLRFSFKVGSVIPGAWTELSLGVGIVTPPDPEGLYDYDEGFFTHIEVNGADANGYGGFYLAARADCIVHEVRLGPAGRETYISDFICHSGMINDGAHVHALRPEASAGSIGSELAGTLAGIVGLASDGNIQDIREWPPGAGSISLTSGCGYFGFYVTEELRYPTDLGEFDRHMLFLPFICNPFATQLVVKEAVLYLKAAFRDALLAPKDVWMVHEFKGLEYHTYATCQVNALAQGSGFAFGITPKGPDWDSNYLQYLPRGSLKYDIVQVCHRHPWLRYMWSPMMLNWLPLGVMAMPEDIEGEARADPGEYKPLCFGD